MLLKTDDSTVVGRVIPVILPYNDGKLDELIERLKKEEDTIPVLKRRKGKKNPKIGKLHIHVDFS